MPLAIGDRLGPYEIIGPLGAGGMGEVYRALDERLRRYVAIKVLPARFGGDDEMLRRFQQEARAAGALNHPNVLAVFDVGADGGVPYVVSELLEGSTLRDRMGGGALPPRRAVELAIQIARGLAAAHDKGIVHRDLKLENIFVTRDGQIKILDFGLAKLVPTPAFAEASTDGAVVATEPTPHGTILGTIGYMSPEQLRGQPTDPRSDLFAFGAIAYEMLSGQRAFKGPTPADTMSAILNKEPPEISTATGPLTPALDRIVRRCLEKEPDARFQSARDLSFALDTLSGVSTPSLPPALLAPARRRRAAAVAMLALGAAAVAAAAGYWAGARTGSAPLVVLKRLTADPGLTSDPAVSRDGKLLAYASDRSGEGNLDIWVQQLAGTEPLRLTHGPGDNHEPSFSPDGSRVVFRSERDGGGIYVVPALGGDPLPIARRGHWPRFSPRGGRIAYAADGRYQLLTLDSGARREIAAINQDFDTAAPVWSPDGRHLLVQGRTRKDWQSLDWWAVDADDERVPPVRTGAMAALGALFNAPCDWSGDHVVFSSSLGDGTNLWNVAISPRTLRVSGPAQRLTLGTDVEAQAALGSDGRLIFSARRTSVGLWSLAGDTIRGETRTTPEPLTSDLALDIIPSLSENGRAVAFISTRAGDSRVWVKNLETGKETLLSSAPGSFVVLHRDGTRVLFAGLDGLYAVASGGGIPEKVSSELGWPTDWMRDGRGVLLQTADGTVRLVDLSGRPTVDVIKEPGTPCNLGRLSPDEKWIAFHCGADEWVAPFRGAALLPRDTWTRAVKGTVDGSTDQPRWSPDGNALYYISAQDGFRCIWRQRLNPATKTPAGEPTAVQHFHSASRSISGASSDNQGLAVARDRLVFTMAEVSGNIWAADFH
jgi:serine/threonine protein kinase/Tol biopolymer transport system component